MKNPYAVLGIPVGSTVEEAKKAYRKLASQLHPDKNPANKEAEERLKDVNLAYEQIQSGKASVGPPPSSADWGDFFQQAGRWRARPEEDDVSIFEQIFRRKPSPSVVEVDIPLSFEESLSGVTKSFEASWRMPCMSCLDKSAAQRGRCPHCLGEGVVSTTDQAEVFFEPGSLHGTTVTATTASGKPLKATAYVGESPLWKREGMDLLMAVPVRLEDVVDGKAVRVITPYAKLDFALPPGSLLGQTIRLRGQGVKGAKGLTGDLKVQVLVELPKNGQSPQSDRYAQQVQAWQKLA